MIHFQGHDDVHEFLLGLIRRVEDEAHSDLVRCRSEWSIEEAKNWLEKVQTVRQHVADSMLVNRNHVRVSRIPGPSTMSTVVKAQILIGTKAGLSDGLRPEAFYRAVTDVETSIRRYLFDPPKAEQTPPAQT
jgi:hypothetical protein